MNADRKIDSALRCAAALAVFSAALFASNAWAGWFDSSSGSGTVVTQTRSVGNFTRIHLQGSTDVQVTVGAPIEVSVRIDDKLQGQLRTEVVGDTLEIGQTGNIGWHAYKHGEGPLVMIKVPSLSALKIDGSGDVSLDGLSGPSFDLGISGSGDVRASGQVDSLHVSIAGSGDAGLGKLQSRSASVSIAGSGDAEVSASGTLNASIAGSGDITYHGSPQVSSAIDGSGDLRHE